MGYGFGQGGGPGGGGAAQGAVDFDGTQESLETFEILLSDPGLAPAQVLLNPDAAVPGATPSPVILDPANLPSGTISCPAVGTGSIDVRIDSFQPGKLLGTVVQNTAGARAHGVIYHIGDRNAVAASGYINCVPGNNINDGERVRVTDGFGPTAYVFEFDVGGTGVASGNIPVVVQPGWTANQVAAAFDAAMASNAGFHAAFNHSQLYAGVQISHKTPGAAANVPIADAVADGGFTVAGMSGGVDAAAAGSLYNDGETFTLDDGVNPPTVFEFDRTGDGVAPGHVPIVLDGTETQAQVGDKMAAAIDGVGPTLQITTELYFGGHFYLHMHNDNYGTVGNRPISDTVADSGFWTSGFAGGIDPSPARLAAMGVQ